MEVLLTILKELFRITLMMSKLLLDLNMVEDLLKYKYLGLWMAKKKLFGVKIEDKLTVTIKLSLNS